MILYNIIHLLLSFSFDWEDILNLKDSAFNDHISKRLEVCQKHSAVHHIFNSLNSQCWQCIQTLASICDILLETLQVGVSLRFSAAGQLDLIGWQNILN